WVEYDHFNTPFIIKDRDFVIHCKMSVDPAKQGIVVAMKSVVDPSIPPTRYVRGELIDSEYVMKPIEGGKKTWFEGEIQVDPKGSVPKWLVNWTQSSWPIDTIEALRKQAKKPDIKEDPRYLTLGR